jgi:hypothetical protein
MGQSSVGIGTLLNCKTMRRMDADEVSSAVASMASMTWCTTIVMSWRGKPASYVHLQLSASWLVDKGYVRHAQVSTQRNCKCAYQQQSPRYLSRLNEACIIRTFNVRGIHICVLDKGYALTRSAPRKPWHASRHSVRFVVAMHRLAVKKGLGLGVRIRIEDTAQT